MDKNRHHSFSLYAESPSLQLGLSGLRVRSDLHSGSFQGCLAYCAQEYNRCLVNGLPRDTCNDRLPVCQNACTACAVTP